MLEWCSFMGLSERWFPPIVPHIAQSMYSISEEVTDQSSGLMVREFIESVTPPLYTSWLHISSVPMKLNMYMHAVSSICHSMLQTKYIT